MKKDIQRLLHHGAIYWIGNAINRLGAFVLLPLYTHYLSLSEYGALELLYASSATLSVLLGAGLSHATLRFYFDYESKKDRNAVITTNLFTSLGLSIAGVLLLASWVPEMTVLLLGDSGYEKALQLVLVIIVIELSSEIGYAYLRAKELSIFYVLLSIAKLITQLVFSVLFVAYWEEGIVGVLKANLICAGLVGTILIFYVIRHCGFSFDLAKAIPVIKYSVPFAGSAIVMVLMINVGQVMLRTYASLEAVGVYGLAMKFGLLLRFMLVEPFQRVYGPFRFSIMNQDDAKDIQIVVTHYFVVAVSFVALGISLFASDVLVIASSEAFWTASSVVPLLLVGVAAREMSYCYQTGLLYQKKTKYILYISMVVFVIDVAGNFILIQLMGVYGAATMFIISGVIFSFLTFYVSQKIYPVSYLHVRSLIVTLVAITFYVLSLFLVPAEIIWGIVVKTGLILGFVLVLYLIDSKVRGMFKELAVRASSLKEKFL